MYIGMIQSMCINLTDKVALHLIYPQFSHGRQWEVAVFDYTFKSTIKKPLYLLTDICEDSYIHGTGTTVAEW